MNQFGTGKEVASMSLLLIFTISIDVLRLTRLETLKLRGSQNSVRVLISESLLKTLWLIGWRSGWELIGYFDPSDLAY